MQAAEEAARAQREQLGSQVETEALASIYPEQE